MARTRVAVGVSFAVLALAAAASAGPKPPHPNERRSDTSWVREGPVPEDQLRTGGRVILALLNDPDSLNPYLSTFADSEDVHRLVFPQLMHEQPDYTKGPPEFTPYLADSWEFSADRTSLTFHLRPDAVWSDGEPITADDVRYSWLTAKDKDVAWTGNSIKDFIDDVKVVDAHTCVLHYTKTYPYQLMDSNDGFILPKHAFEKTPYKEWKSKGNWKAEASVSGGPFRLVDYVPQQQVALERNPKYLRKGYPKLDQVVLRVIKSQQSQLDALLSGGIDVLQTVKPIDMRRILDDGGFTVFNCLSRGFAYIGWNCKKFPFDDPEVRHAMTLAIDRDDLREFLFLGYSDPSVSPIISSMWAADKSIQPIPFDQDEAQKLLESRGWKKGGDGVYAKDGKRFEFKISVNSENQQRVKACTKIQADLAEIGVKVTIDAADAHQLAERFRKHDFEAEYGAWYVATKVDEKPTWHSSSRDYDGYNWIDYENKRIDEIIDTARVMSDFDKAKPLWAEFQRIIHKEQPYTFVAEPRLLNAYRKSIRNVLSAATGPYFNLEEWSLEAAK